MIERLKGRSVAVTRGADPHIFLLRALDSRGLGEAPITHDIEEAIVVADRIVVLTGPPGRIAKDIAVDMPRPRERTSAAVQALRKRIADAISRP